MDIEKTVYKVLTILVGLLTIGSMVFVWLFYDFAENTLGFPHLDSVGRLVGGIIVSAIFGLATYLFSEKVKSL